MVPECQHFSGPPDGDWSRVTEADYPHGFNCPQCVYPDYTPDGRPIAPRREDPR